MCAHSMDTIWLRPTSHRYQGRHKRFSHSSVLFCRFRYVVYLVFDCFLSAANIRPSNDLIGWHTTAAATSKSGVTGFDQKRPALHPRLRRFLRGSSSARTTLMSSSSPEAARVFCLRHGRVAFIMRLWHFEKHPVKQQLREVSHHLLVSRPANAPKRGIKAFEPPTSS